MIKQLFAVLVVLLFSGSALADPNRDKSKARQDSEGIYCPQDGRCYTNATNKPGINQSAGGVSNYVAGMAAGGKSPSSSGSQYDSDSGR